MKMMISSFRKSLCREEAGQAIILGAVSLLVLAVGIMTTAQLGWAIKERIQLQHAADNAAYTSAAMVARSLNFISWTNRATISQYVTAMAFQSFISFFDGITLMVAQVAAMFLSLAFVCGIVGKIPVIGAPFEAASRALAPIGKTFQKGADGLAKIVAGIDKVIAPFVSLISGLNRYVNFWIMQRLGGKLFVESGFVVAAGGGEGFYQQALSGTAGEGVNDGDLGGTGIDLRDTLNLVNLGLFRDLFDSEGSEKIKRGEDGTIETRRAERVMTMLVNASRDGVSSSTKWETFREFSVAKILGVENETAKKILNRITPNTEGASLLAEPVTEKKNLWATSDNDASKRLKENPVFSSHTYFKSGFKDDETGAARLPRGQAMISMEISAGIDKGLPSPLDTIFDWISDAVGEMLPETKVVGVQSAYNEEYRQHCKYTRVGTAEVDLDDLIDKVCDKAGKNAEDKCDEECIKECVEYKKIYDNEGNFVREECVREEWKRNPAASVDPSSSQASEDSFCKDRCPGLKDGNWIDEYKEKQDMKKECKKNAEQLAAAAEEGLNQAIDEAVGALFGGCPAKVFIDCDKQDAAKHHAFDGISPYVSLDIRKFNEKQKNHQEAFPFFLAMVNKNPEFLSQEASALGFGAKYGQGKGFTTSSVGKVEGVTSKDVGDCDDNFSQGCLSEYNYNFLGNGETDLPGLGAGLNAWARAEVYYHRPGTWAEPPNMFNPYWKPKLAPLAPMFTNILGNAGSSAEGSWGKLGALLNSVLGFMKDVVTTVMSH